MLLWGVGLRCSSQGEEQRRLQRWIRHEICMYIDLYIYEMSTKCFNVQPQREIYDSTQGIHIICRIFATRDDIRRVIRLHRLLYHVTEPHLTHLTNLVQHESSFRSAHEFSYWPPAEGSPRQRSTPSKRKCAWDSVHGLLGGDSQHNGGCLRPT